MVLKLSRSTNHSLMDWPTIREEMLLKMICMFKKMKYIRYHHPINDLVEAKNLLDIF